LLPDVVFRTTDGWTVGDAIMPTSNLKGNHSNNPQFEDMRNKGKGDTIPFYSHMHIQGSQQDEVSAHYHEYIEIIYVLSGSVMASVNGNEFTISDGDLLLINAKESHAFRRYTNCRYICLQFDPFVLFSTSRTSFESRFIMPFIMSCSSPQRVISSDELMKTNVGALVEDANREFNMKEYGFELAVRSNICQIFLWFLRKWHAQGLNLGIASSMRSEDIARLEGVLTYIDDNYMRTVSAEKMAVMCSMSYSYFSRFFKSSIGKTFSEYLTYVRLTEAERLLVSTGKNVSQIASDTGFANASYFITQFKKHRQMTPKKFKKKLMMDDPPT
jgi:AraC-like DNA-binding protein/mannose-6-phosphate isomerase-like protein (cupin superfamily)